MALSSNRKSNSSASRTAKPTYRRAKGSASTSKAQVATRPAKKAKKAAKPSKAAKLAAPASRPVKATRPSKTSRPVNVRPVPAAKKSVKGAKRTLQAKPTPSMAKAAQAATKRGGLKVVPAAQGGAPASPRATVSPLAILNLPFAKIAAAALGVLVLVGVVWVLIANLPVFAATDIQVKGSEHIPQNMVDRLVDVPSGATLLNVDTASIEESLKQNPWVEGVEVERQFPHTLIITPIEHEIAAIAYITSGDVAWAIGVDGTWIAPISLSVTVDEDGNIISTTGETQGDADKKQDDSKAKDGSRVLTGTQAALAIARRDDAILFINIPADISPASGSEVTSEVILAGLEYANGFSTEFVNQIEELSLESVDAISANLTSGIEVSLGSPENIALKERVITGLIEEVEGVTYINVRDPENPTYRAL